jgi:hypothetical protein
LDNVAESSFQAVQDGVETRLLTRGPVPFDGSGRGVQRFHAAKGGERGGWSELGDARCAHRES